MCVCTPTNTHRHRIHTQHTERERADFLFKANKLNPSCFSQHPSTTIPSLVPCGPSFVSLILYTHLIVHLSLYSLPIPHTERIKIEKRHKGGGRDPHHKPHHASRERRRDAKKGEMKRASERMKEGDGVDSKLKARP